MHNTPTGTITFLFSDIEGSTRKWEQNPDIMEAAFKRHEEIMRTAMENHGGYVYKMIGDAFQVAFATAPAALESALEAQRGLLDETWGEIDSIKVRIALHTGETDERGDDYVGPVLNRVARLMDAAHGGQILLTRTTTELVQDYLPEGTHLRYMGQHRLKDLERPEHVYQLVAPGLQNDFPPLNTLDAKPNNLPVQLTSFIGRDDELNDVLDLLTETRLLTLTGPGGIGKTRLALQAVGEQVGSFRDGVFFVNLAPISQPELLSDTVMGAIGLKEVAGQPNNATLMKYLEGKEILILLDNFEQIIAAAAQVGEWLSTAPGLKVLVTSREPLRIYGEQEYPVPPLSLPDLTSLEPPGELAKYEAVSLFVQRAREVKPDFGLSDENVPLVAKVCVRLDGLPLAIELAAARAKLFSPRGLLEQMDERFAVLKGGPRDLPTRQQTLWNTINWSYELLDPGEKILLARLSVFQGGRTVEAVEEVCAQDLSTEVLDGLESLLNKNLLRQVEGPEGELRFIMLETIHDFARNRLEKMGETPALRKRHAKYFTALCERADEHIRAGPGQLRWLRRLEANHDNLRTALEWSFGNGQIELGLRMVIALDDFWYRQGHYREGERWTKRALEHSDDASAETRAGVYDAAGLIALYLYDRERGKRMHRKALALYEDFGDRRQIGWALIFLSAHSMGQKGDYEEAVARCEEGVALLQEAGDLAGVAQGLNVLGELARLQGDLRRAKRAYSETLDIARRIGDRLREAMQLGNLGLIAQSEAKPERALELIQQALKISLEIEYGPLIISSLADLAGPLGDLGEFEAAVELIGAAEKLFSEGGFSPQPGNVPVFEGNKKAIREKMTPAEFEAAYARGQEMSLEDAVDYVLSMEGC